MRCRGYYLIYVFVLKIDEEMKVFPCKTWQKCQERGLLRCYYHAGFLSLTSVMQNYNLLAYLIYIATHLNKWILAATS